MRIAVAYENGSVFQHFGHTEHFAFYDIHDTQILSKVVVPARGIGHSALAGFLKNFHVDILICGGIGGGAQNALAQSGIRLLGGVQGDADEAVKAFLENRLDYDPAVHCDHHDHSDHQCGEHGCGEHQCGGSCH